ncbi:hypothetical protein LDL36_17390 [Komagataeibacter sp. FNDCR1]|nr:hypothetical protein [Komagataeibacter sp. FNDCR1]
MPAFSFLVPAILVLGIHSGDKTYQYLPMASAGQCETNVSKMVSQGYLARNYGVCLDTGFPEKVDAGSASLGENSHVPWYLIAQINNDYEYLAMNDEQHCMESMQRLTRYGFVANGLFSGTPYAICINAGFPSLK